MKDEYNQEAVIKFVSFCIENFKIKHKMRGRDVANIFNESGAIDLLMEEYDILHTQGKDYIISEIDTYLEKRGIICHYQK